MNDILLPLFIGLISLFIIFAIIATVLSKKNSKKVNAELLLKLENYKDFIGDFENTLNKIRSLKIKEANSKMIDAINKYVEMVPLREYKDRINNYDNAITELRKLSPSQIKSNVSETIKRLTLIDKYGPENGNKLADHDYFIGMTEDMLIATKGKPTKIEKEELKTKTKIIYIYGTKSSGDVFTFVNGECERFKDR